MNLTNGVKKLLIACRHNEKAHRPLAGGLLFSRSQFSFPRLMCRRNNPPGFSPHCLHLSKTKNRGHLCFGRV